MSHGSFSRSSDISAMSAVSIAASLPAAPCREMDVHVKTFDGSNGAEHKEQFVNQLGAEKTVCIGNGQNDLLMFQVAAISVVIIGAEGCSPQALMSADIAVTKIEDALNLLLNPQRMVATLRT